MAQNKILKVKFFSSGYCTAHAKVVNPISGKGKAKFYAVWALIHIESIGYVLFDTGYSNAFKNATHRFPDRIYRWVTPIQIKQNESALDLLEKEGIQANDIRYIIVSHFHADHIAGLTDFPKAQIICSKSSYQEVKELKGWRAVKKGILHGLIPQDIEQRIQFIEDIADLATTNEQGILQYKLFEQDEFQLIALPGHAKGMLGFIYLQESNHLLYATDAAWDISCFEQKILPKKVVKLFFDCWDDYLETWDKLHHYKKMHSNVNLLFTHCPKTLNYLSNEI
jgi:glyoxylase-like metal-dependent hydrolase (beta-lactamase superfamily II)